MNEDKRREIRGLVWECVSGSLSAQRRDSVMPDLSITDRNDQKTGEWIGVTINLHRSVKLTGEEIYDIADCVAGLDLQLAFSVDSSSLYNRVAFKYTKRQQRTGRRTINESKSGATGRLGAFGNTNRRRNNKLNTQRRSLTDWWGNKNNEEEDE